MSAHIAHRAPNRSGRPVGDAVMKKRCCLIFLSVAVVLWVGGLAVFLAYALSYKTDSDHKADAIVVLTGGQGRIETGLELWQTKAAKHLLITGIYPTLTQADILKRKNSKLALPKCCITYDYNASNTVENAIETQKWTQGTKPQSILLVTSQYHMSRSLQEMHYHIPSIEFIPVAIHENEFTFKAISFLIGEYHKTLYRFVAIRSQQLFPKDL
jgi:uncharacterized SAM-binding protein YcdF (DUF218 family)